MSARGSAQTEMSSFDCRSIISGVNIISMSSEPASSAATASSFRPGVPRKSRNAIASEHTGNISARSCPTVVSSSVAAMYAAPMSAASSTVTQTRKRGPSSTRHKKAAHITIAQALKNRSAT